MCISLFLSPSLLPSLPPSPPSLSQGQTLESHDYVFWCGDLNYRIDLPTHVAKDYISSRQWSKLAKHDQLYKQKKLRKVSVCECV